MSAAAPTRNDEPPFPEAGGRRVVFLLDVASRLEEQLLRDWIERPVILGSLGEIGSVARKASSELREVQTGLVRTYALAIAGSVTVLAFVFVWVK
jgi:hypothetical protein